MYSRYKFHNRVQSETETVEQFVTDLKLLDHISQLVRSLQLVNSTVRILQCGPKNFRVPCNNGQESTKKRLFSTFKIIKKKRLELNGLTWQIKKTIFNEIKLLTLAKNCLAANQTAWTIFSSTCLLFW